MKRQEIKVPLTYIEHYKSDHDGLYVYYGANPAFAYYSQTGFFEIRSFVNIKLGGRARNDKVKLANEVDQLDGPFWLLFSNIFKDEEEFVLKYLQKKGLEPVDQVKAKGASAYRFIF